MGFLHKLWDETLAGPTPESGLGKLRKYDSLISAVDGSRSAPPSSVVIPQKEMFITRSITILKTVPSSAPDSPASSSSSPRTPFTPGTPGEGLKKWRRMKSSADAFEQPDPRSSPTDYDWILISALDR